MLICTDLKGQPKVERNKSIDFFKAIAVFCVICIHTKPFENYQSMYLNGAYIQFVIDSLARFAVPYFFAVSGYLIGEKLKTSQKKQFNQYTFNYLLKVVKIYFSWVFVFIAYDLIMVVVNSSISKEDLILNLNKYLDSDSFLNVFYVGLNYWSTYHLWYLIALVWSVIIISIFIKIRRVKLLLVISFLLNIVGLSGQSYSWLFDFPLETRDAVFFGLFYVTLGFCFSAVFKYEIRKLKVKYLAYLTILFSLLQLGERALLVFYFDAPWGNYFIFTLPVTITILIIALQNSLKVTGGMTTTLGMSTLGIYVIHPLVIENIDFLLKLFHWEYLTSTLAWNIFYTPFVLFTSFYMYRLLQLLKIKFN